MGGKMFTNLIESSSHTSEFKRRGSFFLFTATTYLLLFTIAGVMSIYAFDARLDDQNLERVTMLGQVELASTKPAPVAHNSSPPRSNSTKQNYAERATAMASVNHPEIAPNTVSAKPNTSLPVPDAGSYRITGRDVDPGGLSDTSGPGHVAGSDLSSRGPVVDVGTPPPPLVTKPAPKVISKGVINGQAVSLPKPPYPPIAKQLRIQGAVNVQVLINEAGNVVSAKAISGNPALVTAAQSAAFAARFSPTLLGDQPVKVSGVIIYNFVLQ
jgi:protein TonB